MTIHLFGKSAKAKRKQTAAETSQSLQPVFPYGCIPSQSTVNLPGAQHISLGASHASPTKNQHQDPYGAVVMPPYLPVQSAPAWGPANLPVATSIPANLISAADFNDQWHQWSAGCLNQGSALCDLLSSKLSSVITSIDGGVFSGDERELSLSS